MKTKNFEKNTSIAFAQKLTKDVLIKEEEIIQKNLKNILYERPDDSIVFRIAKNIYEKEFKAKGKKISRSILDSIFEESILFILRVFSIAYIEDNDVFKKMLEENKLYRSSLSFRYFFVVKMQKNLKYKNIINIFLPFMKVYYL